MAGRLRQPAGFGSRLFLFVIFELDAGIGIYAKFAAEWSDQIRFCKIKSGFPRGFVFLIKRFFNLKVPKIHTSVDQ